MGFLSQKISRINRWFMLAISGFLAVVYFVPIWFINLKAPQYRDGLKLNIWLNKITGGNEFDLKNINLLNHYVGMAEIHAENFIEFVYMPYILCFMILGAFVTFFYPNILMVYLGLLAFFTAAGAGLFDFQRWLYNYGHNLDPDAAIAIPGISFEPPLLGCKAMMNFIVCSWPHVGATLLLLSGGLLFYVIVVELLKFKKEKVKEMK